LGRVSLPARSSIDRPTPRRILDAAADEFAEHGFAGARVDRIAERAEANKQRIYAYFGSKDGLFDRVIGDRLERSVEAVPFDPSDLPGYAVRLLDFSLAHPDLVRLQLWSALERPGLRGRLAGWGSSSAKIEALRAVLATRPTPPALAPERLLAQVLALVEGMALRLATGVELVAVDQARDDLRRSVELLLG